LLSRPKLPERSGQKPSSKKKVKLADNTSPSNKGENERRKDAWQVRVGSFTAKKSAEQRLTQALKAAPYPLRHARAMVAARTKGGKKLYLAVFNGMKKEDAVAACKALKRKRIECISGKSSS
jgi:D-alanyl-D-alanine carboxypeptidase